MEPVYTDVIEGGEMERIPICVDLDGTLLNTNLLIESIIRLCKHSPANFIKILYWRLRGKAYLKRKVAEKIPIRCEFLPYNQKVLQYLAEVRKTNQPIVLATGANILYAQKIADHLGFFDRVFASDAHSNLTDTTKRNSLVKAFGEKGFTYIGNSVKDIPIWKAARQAFFVNTSSFIQDRVRKVHAAAIVLDEGKIRFDLVIRQLRIHQWIKNILLFVPLLTSHNFTCFFQTSRGCCFWLMY